MRVHNKHLHIARRKMGHILDEIYTALLQYGSREVDMRIVREDEGLRLYVESNFNEEYMEDMERMGELLQPDVRSAAMVEMYWELAGEDQYTSESEMALVGQMANESSLTIEGEKVSIEIYVAY